MVSSNHLVLSVEHFDILQDVIHHHFPLIFVSRILDAIKQAIHEEAALTKNALGWVEWVTVLAFLGIRLTGVAFSVAQVTPLLAHATLGFVLESLALFIINRVLEAGLLVLVERVAILALNADVALYLQLAVGN